MRPSEVARASSVDERRTWFEYLRWVLFVRGYAAADRAGLTDPALRVAFVRRRLEPSVRHEVIEGILVNLARRYAAGETWVYDTPTIADIVGERMARRIADFGFLPSTLGPEQLVPRTTRRLRA